MVKTRRLLNEFVVPFSLFVPVSQLHPNRIVKSHAGDSIKLIFLSKWFIAVAAMLLVSMPLQSHSGDNEDRVAAGCGISSGPTFAAAGCFVQGLFMQEVEKCLTGGDCLGASNDLVGCNGWLMRNVFRTNCGDATGPGFITIVNKNPYTIRFFVASPTGPTDTFDIGPNMFWTTPYRFVTYRMNWANGSNDNSRYKVWGNVLHNGYSYRFEGSQQEPQLACAQPHDRSINDSRDPCY